MSLEFNDSGLTLNLSEKKEHEEKRPVTKEDLARLAEVYGSQNEGCSYIHLAPALTRMAMLM